MGVGEDVALLGDYEPGSLSGIPAAALRLRAEEGDDGDDAPRPCAVDRSGVEVVAGERLPRPPLVNPIRRRRGRRLGEHDRVGVAVSEPAGGLRNRERGRAAQQGADDRNDG